MKNKSKWNLQHGTTWNKLDNLDVELSAGTSNEKLNKKERIFSALQKNLE
jgi:hypothetical protein